MGHDDESLIDKVKNALGMGDDDAHDEADTTRAEDAGDRPEGWAGVPEALYDDTSAGTETRLDGADEESGLGRNPGPVGSARYENTSGYDDLGGADVDAPGTVDSTREDAAAGEFGGAYGEDDTAMPTSAAYDRGEAPPPGVASFGDGTDDEDDSTLDRRGTGI